MICDIHCFAEKRLDAGWRPLASAFFNSRSYHAFGFLADVRNYAAFPPIAAPRGLPQDASATIRRLFIDQGTTAHTPSWLSLDELNGFEYDRTIEDRSEARGAGTDDWRSIRTCDAGEGTTTTYKRLLGRDFFTDLERLKQHGADRIVFWFDN